MEISFYLAKGHDRDSVPERETIQRLEQKLREGLQVLGYKFVIVDHYQGKVHARIAHLFSATPHSTVAKKVMSHKKDALVGAGNFSGLGKPTYRWGSLSCESAFEHDRSDDAEEGAQILKELGWSIDEVKKRK